MKGVNIYFGYPIDFINDKSNRKGIQIIIRHTEVTSIKLSLFYNPLTTHATYTHPPDIYIRM